MKRDIIAMDYLILLVLAPAIWATAYAITVPIRVQKILNVSDQISPDEFLSTLSVWEKAYLILSATPFILAPLFLFSSLERGKLYCVVIVVLAIVGVIFRDLFLKYKKMIIVESVAELIIYCDAFRSVLQTIKG